MSIKKKILIIFLVFVTSVIFSACGIFAYAYFSNKDVYDGYFSGQVELLFDRLNDTGITNYNTANTDKVDKSKTWGSKEYPYVISDVRHLYNLSELQRLGYFDKKFISQNTTGSYSNIPYFLVCTPEYNPVAIDGTNFKGITSIGTDKYPFIGSVKGVKNTGATVEVNEKACDTSAICNVTVAGDPHNVDVGLFGKIGYLGTAPEITEQTPTPTFSGQISTISNLVLSDVKVEVKSSAWADVISFVEDIMINATEGHNYSFSGLHGTDDYDKVPHENHHIGILAGHAAYTKIEFISVYYSSDSVVAIDLTDETVVDGKNANYLSATGILGFIDNLNPDALVGENGNQTITAGSGDSLGDISYNPVGGGGASSGNKAGYVLAGEMYNKYHFTEAGEDTTGTIKIKDAMDENGKSLCTEWVRKRLLWGTENTGRYYFYDGVFTFALSDPEDIIEPTWDTTTVDTGYPVMVNSTTQATDGEGNPLYYDVPEFSIGNSNDPAKWQTNTSQGNKAAIAYVKEIENDSALQAAITAGKKIFIMQEKGNDLFLMSLYNQSTAGSGNFGQKYTTPGSAQKFADQELVTGIVNAYNKGTLKLLPTTDINYDMTSDYNSEAKVAAALTSGELKAINVGMTSSSVNLDTLRAQYKITAANIANSYKYFVDYTPVAVNNDGKTINEYYDYAKSNYYGYFYYTETGGSLGKIKYEYFWQPTKGEGEKTPKPLGSGETGWWGAGGSNLPSDVFSTRAQENGADASWGNENVYTYTYQNKEYTGVAINKTEGTFYNSGNKASANSATLTKLATGQLNFFYKNIGENVYHYSNDTTDKTYTITDNDKKMDNGKVVTSISGQPIYVKGENEGVLLDRYLTYTFSANDKDGKTNFLRMIEANFDGGGIFSYGNQYVLWNGNEDAAKIKSNFSHAFTGVSREPTTLSNSKEATLRFDLNGTCYIQYSIGNTGLYVNSTGLDANSTVKAFNTIASNTDAGAKLRIYSVEGTQDISYGRITFDPIDDPQNDTDSYTFNTKAEENKTQDFYLLKAGHSDTANPTAANNTTYEVKSLTDLGWNNGEGSTLSQADLTKKFKMIEGISFGFSFNLGSGTLGSNGIITAPVGTDGVQANIPQSCIAFKMNKENITAKIRVIVSVAVSEYYPGEKNDKGELVYDLGDYTRYFNLWKMEAAGESTIQMFDATGDALMDRFEVPRSHPYQPGTPLSPPAAGQPASEIPVAEYINVKYGGNTYRCYLNGDRVLIAYEFTVNTNPTNPTDPTVTPGTGTGVYCLGMSGITTNGDVVGAYNSSVQGAVPMEIVYFSADGVASTGRDGENNSQIGTIDFVYDNNNTVVTVTEESSTDADGNEDYSTYYPSYCLLYFDTTQKDGSAFKPVNTEVVKIYRHVETTADSDKNHTDTPSRSTLFYDLTGGNGLVKIAQYSRFADNIRQKNVELNESPPTTGG